MITHSPIIEDTIKNGGGTYRSDLRGKAELPEAGFIVSTVNVGTCAMSARGSMTALLDRALQYHNYCEQAHYIGTWIDGDTCYVDISRLFSDRATASMLCRELGELAYYDIAAGESVTVAQEIAS